MRLRRAKRVAKEEGFVKLDTAAESVAATLATHLCAMCSTTASSHFFHSSSCETATSPTSPPLRIFARPSLSLFKMFQIIARFLRAADLSSSDEIFTERRLC